MLRAGQRLGPFEIITSLGAGGMGDVYKARDTRLDRTVAIKIVKTRFSERFEREARAISSLNHPNICALFDIGHENGTEYLVMEHLEGDSLADRLARGRLSREQALAYATQIAGALDAAHRQGIVHRDLKPANIMLTRGGAKLLDFGLAKAMAVAAGAGEDARTVAATQEGVLVGTYQYMAPEQLEGKSADARSDIFAFGAVVYEMLAGTKAFPGDSQASVIAAILDRQPAPLAREQAGGALERVLRRTLEKDPELRWQCAGDLAAELRAIGTEPAAAEATAAIRKPRLGWRAGGLVLLLLAVLAGTFLRRGEAAPQWSAATLGGPGIAIGPRVSPDGHLVAFAALVNDLTQVGVMKPETGNWTLLTRGSTGVDTVCWSADGSRIYFDREVDRPRGVYSVPVLGGDERLLLPDAGAPEVLPDGSLIVARINAERQVQLYHFWPDTGKLQPLPALLGQGQYVVGGSIRAFPDGKEIAFYGRPLAGGDVHLYTLALATGAIRRLAPNVALFPVMGPRLPIAVSRDGNSVIVDAMAGSLHRILEVPRDGGAKAAVLLTLTSAPWFLDMAADGSLYADQMERPVEVLRFPVSGGMPQRLAESAREGFRGLLPLPGDRLLMPGPAGGRERLLLIHPGEMATPLLDTGDQTAPPVALIGGGRIAFLIGGAGKRDIGIASLSGSGLMRRISVPQDNIVSLGATADGNSLLYAAGGSVWSVPMAGGAPHRMRAGDSFALYPGGDAMLVQLNERDRVRLIRVPLNGGPDRELQLHGDTELNSTPLAPNAIAPDGRILAVSARPESWFYEPAVIDGSTGAVKRIPVERTADYFVLGWDGKGQALAMAMDVRCTLWRFQPER